MSERKNKKQIQFPKKPNTADAWITQGKEKGVALSQEKTKRLTLDLPESLHRAIKRQAVDEGVPMVDMLRELLEEHYSAD